MEEEIDLSGIEEYAAKFTAKDSVFTDLFKNKKYTFQLYKALHPEDTDLTEDDIVLVTIENILVASLYNDLGFMVKDKLIILVEAQSTWTMNIIIRMLMYLAESYHNYYKKTHQSLYGSKKVDFPKPELYMIFIGERKDKKEVISLTEEFLGGADSSLEIKVNVIYDGKNGDIINQYVAFTKVYNEQVKIYGRTRKAVEETIRICADRDILREYLIEREKEVITMLMTLFDQKEILKDYVRSIAKDSKEEGIQEGGILSMVKMCKKFGASLSDTIKEVAAEFGMSEPDAEIRVKEIW